MSQPCSLHCYNNNIPSFKIKQQLPFFGSLGSLICDAHMDIHLKINHEPPLIFLTSFIFDYWIYDVHKDIYTDIHIKKKQSWTPLTWKKYIFEITDFVTHIYTNIHLKKQSWIPINMKSDEVFEMADFVTHIHINIYLKKTIMNSH